MLHLVGCTSEIFLLYFMCVCVCVCGENILMNVSEL
jgi:hypothetical protein